MIKHILKTSIKDFTNNKILTVINMAAIVSALVLITMASSWICLNFSPVPPAEKAKSFYRILSNGKREDVTITDCETINKAMTNGIVWYFGGVFVPITVSRNNKNIKFNFGSSDFNFWKALNFKFINGGPITETQFLNKDYVTVVSEGFANTYFGSTDAVGKYFTYGQLSFRVVGIYKSIPATGQFTFDIYIPHSLLPENIGQNVNACFLSFNSQGIKDLEIFLKKYKRIESKDEIQLHTVPYLNSLLDFERSFEYWGAVFVAFLLPILCFANMFTRKMELKIPEMAIKRAFGATRKNIFLNLVADNVFYVGIAGLIALLITHPLIGLAFNPTGTESMDTDFLYLTFYLNTILLYLVFGVVSAIRPAWKVSGKSIISNI
jgi:putative ABC transport system permease protein